MPNAPDDHYRDLQPMPERAGLPSLTSSAAVPAIVMAAGEDAARHFLNFFIASIRNPHTRRAYARQVRTFLSWCEARKVTNIRDVQTPHVSAYVETLTRNLDATSVKQALASLRMLFDWLVVHQVMKGNPASVVRGPRLAVAEGSTPALEAPDVARILDGIPTDTVVGLRDRALIGVMAYTFARAFRSA